MPDDEPSCSPIHSDGGQNNGDNQNTHDNRSKITYDDESKNTHCNANENNNSNSNNIVRRVRPPRACTARSVARLHEAAAAEAAILASRRKKRPAKKERPSQLDVPSSPSLSPPSTPGGNVVTRLVPEPEPSQLPRSNVRSMWELASILNFLNVFRPLLNIKVEFSAEEFETALVTPNNTLGDIHMPLLKAIPPVTRMALGHNTWVTVLCRKLRDWWHWVAEGNLPIVASHGAEVEAYNALDPRIRVVILKALCDIRVEQEDIRNYIDDSVKHGAHLSAFRKERIGGDSHGISYWYEDDCIIGHRLYREIRKVEVKKGKGKNVLPLPSSCYQWETVATNLDEFQHVSEKLFLSKNRTEASLGKKLKNDMLPEIDKVHKRKEKLLKKQHREALLLDNMLNMDGLVLGRSLRDRKPVTYTFDDFDRSINEAIKITKWKQTSPEPTARREVVNPDSSTNGKWGDPSQNFHDVSFNGSPLKPHYYDETDENHKPESLARSNRQRRRPQWYSAKEYVEADSDNDVDFNSDDDIVGEAVYDDEYLRRQKQTQKLSSSSEGDEEYNWDEDNVDDEDDEEEESLSISEDSDELQNFRKLPARTRRETKLRSVDGLEPGLRRSRRATRNCINYRRYELSESETESSESETSNASVQSTSASDNPEFSTASQNHEANDDNQMDIDLPVPEHPETVEEKVQIQPPEKVNSPSDNEVEGPRKRRFLDLNELAPCSAFDDGHNLMKDENMDDL